MVRFFRWALLFTLASATNLAAANPARYVGRLQSGATIEGNTLSDWHATGLMPKLENQALLEPANPFRWLIDRSWAPPPPPDSFVEFVTGDRLPGTVLDYRTGNESLYSPQPPHVLVRYAGTNPATLERQMVSMRVDTRWLQRIVWRSRGVEQLEPGVAFFNAGNFLRFRSVRLGTGSATFLTEAGVRRVSFAELAELHLPRVNFWPAAIDELAVLAPSAQSRLIQLETTDGLIATTSLERYQPRVAGDARDVSRWVHGLQPAWSLDMIWVPQGTVWSRRSFAPHEMPLSRVPPLRFEQHTVLGNVQFPFKVNRNVFGGPLRSGTREVGWGLGVHAFAELEYELPPATRAIRSEFGLDASMNDGGCVIPRIINASENGSFLYQGPTIVGSGNVVDTGTLPLTGSAENSRRVVLQVDPAVSNRPAGADPFDIRDSANWIDPTVEFDLPRLREQIDERVRQVVQAWRGWDVAWEARMQTKWINYFAEAPANLGEYYPAIGIADGAMKLTLKRPLTDKDGWLVIDAVRTQPAGPSCKVSIRLGDQMPTEHDVPVYDKGRSDYRPIVLSLAAVRMESKPPAIEIQQLPTAESIPVLWRCVTITTQHPMLFRLFEDELSETIDSKERGAGTTKIEFDDQQKYFGTRSLALSKQLALHVATGSTLAIRERPQLGEYRFLRFAVRKQGEGGFRVRLKHSSSQERAAIYESSPISTASPTVRYLASTPLKQEWVVFTRDLYGDFGKMELNGITFEIPDGTKAWIDHIYLARTQNDFDLIKTAAVK